MPRNLLVATHNSGKLAEYAEILSGLYVDWLSFYDVGVTMEVAETGTSFQENAIIKAAAYARSTGILTLADDSGLEVDALDGAPGVYTARYGGLGLSSEERCKLLLRNLDGIPRSQRTARFCCAIALAGVDGHILATSSGVVEGIIAVEPAGEGGFGYDPIFFLPELNLTMAQLPPHTKHGLSHRGRALQALEPQLRMLLARG